MNRILRTGLVLIAAGYIGIAGGCGAKTFARLKDFNNYMTSAEKPGDGWYDVKEGAKKFREANSPKKIMEGIDNAGVDLVNFFIPDNYSPSVSLEENVSVSEVGNITVK